MNGDKSCGCDVGGLAYADDVEVVEPDLVLDDPEPEVPSAWRAPRGVGAFTLFDDPLIDLDDEDLGFLDTALNLGLKLGKRVADVVAAPSKSKAKQAQRKAAAAQQQAAALKAELEQAKEREERQRRQQQIIDERRRNQTHEREKRELEAQIKELQEQQLLVRREVGKKAAEVREVEEKAAAEKQRQSLNRKLAIGGGVAATSLLAVWALSRKRKPEDEKGKRR